MDMRDALILQRARQTLEVAKARREELEDDIEQRSAMEIPRVSDNRLIYKRHDPTPPPDQPKMSSETQDWADWINDRIETRLLATVEAISEKMLSQDAHVDTEIRRLTEEVKSLRAALRRKPKQLQGPSAEIKQLRGPTSVA